MPNINININGKDYSAITEERQLLVNFIRDEVDLTGTHHCCDTSQCGSSEIN